MRSVAVANQKGGVGKTTTSIHLAHGLALAGCTVVLIDLDPQGNATLAVEQMSAATEVQEQFAAFRAVAERFWVLPSPGAHKNFGPETWPDVERLQELVQDLAAAGIDWVLVDCAPRMDRWGTAGVRICEEILIPVQTEFLAIHAVSQMMRTIESLRTEHPGTGKLLGVLATMYEAREIIAQEVIQDLATNLGDRLLRTRIYRDPVLVEASSHGVTAFDYSPMSKGARSYGELVREVLHG